MSIFAGNSVKEDRSLSCDVCIVGSGAGGAVMAARLAAAGKRVIVLEDGGFHTSDTFSLREVDAYSRLYQEAGSRATADKSISILQGRAVGGTTVVNWTTCFRTPEWVLGHWAEHFGADALATQISSHFDAIEERVNVHQMKLEQVNANNRVLWDGAKALGFEVELLRRNVKRCMHTGYCGMGCPVDAKQSMLTTFVPDAVKAGADIYANAWVSHVERQGRRITKAVAQLRDPLTERFTGVKISVEASVFVMAGGGINTPALLLRSELDSNGRTGKRTFLHPTALVGGRHEKRIDGFKGSPQYVGSGQFARRSEGEMGYLLEAAPIFPVLGTSGFTFGAELTEYMDNLAYHSATIGILQDGFDVTDSDEGGTVTVAEDGRPSVDYKWNARLVEALRHSAIQAARIQFAAGAKRVFLAHSRPVELDSADQVSRFARLPFGPGEVGVFSAHVMGGCAMGADPKTSVVDAKSLRHHGHDNLFVADGSVLPTAATVNPQITIYGLSSWASQFVEQAV